MTHKPQTITCKFAPVLTELHRLEADLTDFIAALPRPIDPQDHYDLWLALHELFANIVTHGDHPEAGRVCLTLAWQVFPAALIAEVSDQGRPFTPGAVTCPAPELLQEGGYGLFLIYQLMDEFEVTTHASGNTWRLLKLLQN